MGLISFIILVAVVGLIVYLLTTFIPMPPAFKTVIYVIAIIVLIVFLMQAIGFTDVMIPHIFHR